MIKSDRNNIANLIKFWRSLETFKHPDLDSKERIHLGSNEEKIFKKIKSGDYYLFGIVYSTVYLSLLLELNIFYRSGLDLDLIYDNLSNKESFVYRLDLRRKEIEDRPIKLNLAVWATGKALNSSVENTVMIDHVDETHLICALKEITKIYLKRNNIRLFVLLLSMPILSCVHDMVDPMKILEILTTMDYAVEADISLDTLIEEIITEESEDFVGDIKDSLDEIRKKLQYSIYKEFSLIENVLNFALEFYIKKKGKESLIKCIADLNDIVLRMCYFSKKLFINQRKIISDTCKINDSNDNIQRICRILGELVERQIKNDEGFFYKDYVTLKEDSGMFENFFLDDLYRLEKTIDRDIEEKRALKLYLLGTEEERIDVRDEKNREFLLSILNPENFPSGAWPSPPLVFSQQLAVNAIIARIGLSRDNNRGGIFSINGPPGTGKTTLLKELVAGIVTERVKRLIGLIESGKSPFMAEKNIRRREDNIMYYEFAKELFGFCIVVASSNNSAVENVSLEWPQTKALNSKILRDFLHEIRDKFRDLASNFVTTEEIEDELLFRNLANRMYEDNTIETWGLISAALGKKENREKFISVILEPILKALERARPNRAYFEEKLKILSDMFRRCEEREYKVRSEIVEKIREYFEYKENGKKISELAKSIEDLKLSCEELNRELTKIQEELVFSKKQRPTLLEIILTLGREYVRWRRGIRELERKLFEIERQISGFENKLRDFLEESNRLEERQRYLKERLEGCRDKLDELLCLESEVAKRELSNPFHFEEWRKLRNKLFILSLEIMRTFLFFEAEKFRENLKLTREWLRGGRSAQGLRDEHLKIALETLSFVVPVVSTTFASVERMFRGITGDHIGWLLIDEAGQSLPHHAVGAISRAKRVIVVGDPLQLEPVCPISSNLIEILGQHFQIKKIHEDYYSENTKKFIESANKHQIWYPNRSSCQILADLANPLGTKLRSLWIGAPLRVHRRCARPMFDICNEIAYDGLMVYGVKHTPVGLPTSCWIDIPNGKTKDRDSHYIEQEGELLKDLVSNLDERSVEDLYILSPFKSCADEINRILSGRVKKDRIGTVHVAQGREAKIVILVLGGNPGRPGAMEWVTSKPNLLNVAISRAKEYIYVIGDFKKWKKYQGIDVIMKYLNSVRESDDFLRELRVRYTEVLNISNQPTEKSGK